MKIEFVKKYGLLLLLGFMVQQSSFAQSPALIEWKYLQLINVQNDAKLIADDYRNAELVSDSIIYNEDESYPNAHFYAELAKSYQLNKKNGLWAFSLLRQHCLFPNDSLQREGIVNFVEACYRLDIPKARAVKIFKEANKAKNFKAFSDKLNLLIESSINLYDSETDVILMRYLSFYNSLGNVPSYRLRQWAYLTKINLHAKKKERVLELNNGLQFTKLWQVDDSALQKRILMRAEHYYRKQGAKAEARNYLSLYKMQNVTIFNRIQMLWRRLLLQLL